MSKARGAPTLLISLLVSLVLVACGDDESTSTSSDAAGSTTDLAGQCEDVAPAQSKSVKLPPPKATEPTASAIVFDTNCGSFTVELSERSAKTAANMQYLAEQGVYDGTAFQRVATGFLIQGGDPSGTGAGDPGYHLVDKPPANTAYTQGVVAMTKTDAEPPGTQGCQFFVVTGADAGQPPDYAVAGKVTEGLDTVLAIQALGQPGVDGPPIKPVVIASATVQK
jgi:cyclophilin family peptidyl-prolyl cis-trans isomerase